MRILSVVGLAILITLGNPAAFAQQEIPSDLVITLARYPCYGWCPSYSLTIGSDGVVKFAPLPEYPYAYLGKGEISKLPIMGNIPADQIALLLKEFEKIKFNSLRKQYGSEKYKSSWTCPKVATDSASAEITIVRDGKRKTVWHYLGCSGTQTLVDLEVLENKIDEVTNSKQWVSQFGWGAANVVDMKITKNPK